jgi:hypothetical protein
MMRRVSILLAGAAAATAFAPTTVLPATRESTILQLPSMVAILATSSFFAHTIAERLSCAFYNDMHFLYLLMACRPGCHRHIQPFHAAIW